MLQRRYSRNPAGHITRIESEEGASAYTYDRLGRLTQAEPDQALKEQGLPNEAYSWDAAGNRLSSAHQAGAWTYNEANQLLQYPRALDENAPAQQSQTEQVSASYNALGHLIKETGAGWERNWRYNAAGRLSEIRDSADGLTVQYRYDPFGRRIAKTVTQGATSRTTYYINGESALMAEADEEGRLTRAYGFNPHTQQSRTNEEDEDAEEGSLWSTDPIWQADLNGKTSLKEASYHYLVTDHLGVPVLALNKAGETTWKARYEAFGKARIDHASTAQINLRLPGQYFDAETGLHQNWNRDYAPGIGRYVQADPIGLEGGINVYEYAYGNPLVYYDPYGLFGMDSVWGGIYRMTGGWTPSQEFVDFSAGFGDVMSLQLTKKTRKIFDFGQSVDVCSNSYFIGEMATMLMPIGMLGRVSKIARFSNNPFKYELGQKTVSDKVWKELGLANKTPEQRSDIIIASKGWLYAFFSFSGNWRATLSTGPTPGAAAGLVVVAAGMGGYAISQKLDCICK